MALFYALVFFPYSPHALPARLMTAYLRAIAAAVGSILSLFVPVTVDGVHINGAFPLQIVLDCSALDAQALYLAAVLAWPVTWACKAVGALGGLLLLNGLNLARIVLLFFVGVHWTEHFHFLHEEVLQLAMVVGAAGIFAAWVAWARTRVA